MAAGAAGRDIGTKAECRVALAGLIEAILLLLRSILMTMSTTLKASSLKSLMVSHTVRE